MHDNDTVHRLPLPVAVQPDPMLDEQPAGPFRIAATGLGAAAVVVLVFYGLSRPAEPVQMASAPAQAEQGAAPQPSTTGSGQNEAQPAQNGPAKPGPKAASKSPTAAQPAPKPE